MATINNIIAIIPARGGSQRVPGKNLLELAGHPLVAHSIMHARQAKRVDSVYVSSDDVRILEVASQYGAIPIERPVCISDEKSSSESAILHVLDARNDQGMADPEFVVFLQCTSPIRRPMDIDRAVSKLEEDRADSLFSACRNVRLFWKYDGNRLVPINYDAESRKMEQDMEIQYNENGSIYVIRTSMLRKNKNRLGGKISVYEMDEWSSFQIDTKEHVELVQWILRHAHTDMPNDIQLIVFDFDGVMTDNKVYVSSDGTEFVCCDRADGWGIAGVRKIDIPMIILSTEKNPVVQARADKLCLPCYQGVDNKLDFIKKYVVKNDIDPKKVLYVGNDVNDVECMEYVGFPVSVADTHPDLLVHSKFMLSCKGGHGAVRELCDRILAAFASEDRST